MRTLSGNQIREEFLRFFETKLHRRVHSSSLVPANDPTLLFTNAGMNQFKDVFLGAERRDYARAVTSQKCVRAGGKHNDLENVGFTRRHQTFFEMLGNFSFGDYFKRDAISFAWELLTDPAWFAIDKSKLYVTIFEGLKKEDGSGGFIVPRDDEAEQFWIATGVPKDRIFEMSAKDNFWQMGDTGPCGPCSEIFYDLGLAASEEAGPDGRKIDKPFPHDDQRYVEIWNLVFMQFDRSIDAKGDATLTPLPKPSIDTGMGLERLATVLQGKLSNYESDLFTPLIAAAARLTNFSPAQALNIDLSSQTPDSTLKGTGFSPSITSKLEGGALAPEGLSKEATGSSSGLQPAEKVESIGDSRLAKATGSSSGLQPAEKVESIGDPRLAKATGSSSGLQPAENGAQETRALAPGSSATTSAPHNVAFTAPAGDDASHTTDAERQRRDLIPAQGNALGNDTPTHQRAESPTQTLTPADIAHLAVSDDKPAASLRIIADHARALTFLISDGVLPSNEGRGYVLRKILRRGIRHGRLLGQEKPFMHQMVYAVRDEMVAAYPELKESADRVAKVVLAEEHQFARVMEVGFEKLLSAIAADPRSRRYYAVHFESEVSAEKAYRIATSVFQMDLEKIDIRLELLKSSDTIGGPIGSLASDMIDKSFQDSIFSGAVAFRLYETFGLPKDFIEDVCRDEGIAFDDNAFERAKEEEQTRARASWKGGSQKSAAPVYRELPKTEFEGYQSLRVDGAKVIALVKDGIGVQSLKPGETGEVVLDATSFYADSGGQVGDIGWLYGSDHHTVLAEVTGCKKPVQGVFAHQVIAKQHIAVNDTVDTVVNGEVRNAVMRNHTGTHLLHAALRQVLGTHVKQAGSLNDPNRLRFDFSHFTGVAEEELAEIESIVNTQILKNSTVQTFVDVPIDEAIHEYGAMALFGEKYGDKVRVVKIGDFSTELCGGTHTSATGEIGLLKLVGEGAVASGVRRVEAVSGTGALDLFRRDADVAKVAGQFVGGSDLSAGTLRARVNAQDEEMKKLRRELEQMRMKSASAATADAAGSAVEVKGIKVLAQRVDALDKSQMRNLVDELRGKLGSGVVILGAAGEGKVSLIVGVTKDLTARLQAGKIVGALAAKVGGKGGGRPDLAEAGGSDASALDDTLDAAKKIIADLLG